MLCVRGHEVKVLKSGAGWYIGTVDTDGCPYCRISISYYETKEEAERMMVEGFAIKDYAENEFCFRTAGGCSCFEKGGN